jgi:AAA family ATP:ADP antiporter
VPGERWLAAAYYWWFSVVNLFMISVFWSLMVDLFSPGQATRLFAVIAAGGSTGAIAGPVLTRGLVSVVGVSGLLLIAAGGFVVVVMLVHLLMREKQRLQSEHVEVQASTLDHRLSGTRLFKALFSVGYTKTGAVSLLMTWIATIAYFANDLIARTFTGIEARTVALVDIDLVVNICSALVLLFGLGRYIARFGVTAALVLNPILMVIAFVAVALSPTLLMLQAMQVVRRVSQYAIARPSREICFTVVPRKNRCKPERTTWLPPADVSAAGCSDLRALGLSSGGLVGLFRVGLWGLCHRPYVRAAAGAGPARHQSSMILATPGNHQTSPEESLRASWPDSCTRCRGSSPTRSAPRLPPSASSSS